MKKRELTILLCGLSILFAITIPMARAQNNITSFSPSDKFIISKLNSNISFTTGGSYHSSDFDGTFWHFYGLKINGATFTFGNFSISAQDCNVTILSYVTSSEYSSDGYPSQGVLNYTVIGNGNQTLNLNIGPGRAWSVFINNVEGGWVTNYDESVLVNGTVSQTSNVTLINRYISHFTPPAQSGIPNQNWNPLGCVWSIAIVALIITGIVIMILIEAHRFRRIQNEGALQEK